MAKSDFNLFSLSGQRLAQEVRLSNSYDLDSYTLSQIIRTLYDNDVHLLSRPQEQNIEALSFANNISSLDPHGIYYTIRSEAEHNLLEMFDGTKLIIEACDIAEVIEPTGLSFVHRPYTAHERVWSFVIGSAPVVWSREGKEYLSINHPEIINASETGLAKSMRYTF